MTCWLATLSLLCAVVARVPLPPGPPQAVALQLTIGQVHNPDRVPLTLAVAIVDDADAQHPLRVGTVSLFPSDQPGRFVMRLPTALRDAIQRQAQASRQVIVSLVTPPEAANTQRAVLGQIEAELVPEPQ
jgi:hypothetical protein